MDKMTHTKFNLNNFLLALSEPLDNCIINNNRYKTPYSSKRVAFIALKIATFNDFSKANLSDILSYAILDKHKLEKASFEIFPLNDVSILENKIFQDIFSLAHMIEDMIRVEEGRIVNKKEIIENIEKLEFDEVIKENFFYLGDNYSFWFDLSDQYRLPFFILDMLEDETIEISYETLIAISKIISDITYIYTNRRYETDISFYLKPMCQCYNFDLKDTSRMIISGYLYTIGLCQIPQYIFQKEGTLSDEEYEIIASAPYHTKKILSLMYGFDDISKLASSYAEKIDGSGYPYRLEGNDLGLKNRLFTILTLFQALIEKRVYREAFTKEEGLKELISLGEGGTLDLSIVKDFQKILIS
jgi:HD-GYP domain-containing protein (c-di-GMP phosphodiesterase class II)